MTMNPLPPQAYTKDTLVLAYAWLQSQNESIKEIATSPDILVSLYLKAKLQGESALERPSIKNFKTELKSLAGMMGEFEVINSEVAPSNVRVRANSAGITSSEHKPEAKTDLHNMDLQSLTMIQEVKTKLNLSSEQEALRLLLSVGYNHAKALFK